MSNVNIRQLKDPASNEVFYPQTDVMGLVHNGEYGVEAEPTAGSVLPVQSGGVLDSIIKDGSAFDLSAHTGDSYASLSAALTAMNALSSAYKKGGMSIKYVQSSDNNSTKYVQYRLMADEFSTDEADWQGVDDEPVAGSNNLVQSSGVAEADVKAALGLFIDETNVEETSYYYFPYFDGKSSFRFINTGLVNVFLYIRKQQNSMEDQVSISLLPGAISTNIISADYKWVMFYRGAQQSAGSFRVVPVSAAQLQIESDIDSLKTSVDAINNCDTSPTENSTKFVTSGGVYHAIAAKPSYADISLESTEDVASTDMVGAKYISSNGGLTDTLASFKVHAYPVTPGDVVTIHCALNTGVAYAYAFYSSSSYSSSTAVQVGAAVTAFVDPTTVTVPATAAYILIQEFNGTAYGLKKKVYTPIKSIIPAMESDISNLKGDAEYLDNRYIYSDMLAYQYDGTNLYVAWNNGNGKEFTYWFKKCMANELFTFYRVGYRNVDRISPDASNISTDSSIVVINATGSDNIGPFSMYPGGWVGGNHTYQNGGVKTAKTDSVVIMVDGKALQANDSGYGKDVSVMVENTIYDPAVAPEEGDTILSTKLCSEYALYAIRKSTIEVGLSHQFVGTTDSINAYYGMQSMFDGEDYVLTPNGEYVTWTAIGSISSFTKQDYPHFNRFIEKSTAKSAYQSVYLNPNLDLGDHSQINDSTAIFSRGSGKDYHSLIYNKSATNKTFQWKGCYTFFTTPFIDNNDVFVYTGVVDGRNTVFISTKQAFTGFIDVPSEMALRMVKVVECNGITSIGGDDSFLLGSKLYIESVGVGSLILSAM